METIREKREQHKKLRYFSIILLCTFYIICIYSAVKTLGEPDNDDYSAVSWLKKFDLVQEEKEKAQRRVCITIPTFVCRLFFVCVFL